MTSLAHNLTNDTRKADLLNEVAELGRESALGADAYAKTFLKVVEAAANNIVDTEKDADGTDDAYRILERFVAAKEKKSLHERTKDSVKAQAAKMRTAIRYGNKRGSEAIATMDTAAIFHKEMRNSKIEVKAAYPAYIKVASEAYKSDTPLTEDQIRGFIAKEKADKDVEDELKAIEAKMDNLVVGKNGLQCQDPRLVEALNQVKGLRAELELARKKEELREQAAELGIALPGDVTIVPATEVVATTEE